MARATALVIVCLLAGACASGPAAPFTPGAPGEAVVTDVIDGDTLDVEVGAGAVERVRLIGIDTPESVDPDRPVECHGPEAAALLAALVPPGTTVRLERDEEARDRYGRLLAYVFRADDGLFVNEAVAAAGEAELLEIPPNTAYGSQLRAVAGASRAAGVGLWGACGVPP
jgi:micrococcal nuclease